MKKQNRATPILSFLLCALCVVLLALLPAGMFALTDTARFGEKHSVANAYTTPTPEKDDFYLLRMLNNRTTATKSSLYDATPQKGEANAFYRAAQSSIDTMVCDWSMGQYARRLLSDMADSGALPQEWYAAVDAEAAELENKNSAAPYYYSTDTLGFVTICCFEGTTDIDRTTLFRLTVESHTGVVVSLWISSAAELTAPTMPDALQAWVEQAGLSDLGDWISPTGTTYAYTGLWSARGEVLALCSSHAYSLTQNDQRYFLSMEMVPCTAERLQDYATVPAVAASAPETATRE